MIGTILVRKMRKKTPIWDAVKQAKEGRRLEDTIFYPHLNEALPGHGCGDLTQNKSTYGGDWSWQSMDLTTQGG